MAGESPDKSEQRKSSEGTAPGTSDPRLAVFRSVPDPEAGAASGSQSGDARLREAVAAWVAGADAPADAPDAAGGPEVSGPSGGSGPSDAAETRVMPGMAADGPEAGSEGAQGASGAVSAADAPEGAPAGGTARTGASDGADDPAEPDGDAAAGADGAADAGTDAGTASGTASDTGADAEPADADAGAGADADEPDAKPAGDAGKDVAAATTAEDKPAAEPDAKPDVADAKATPKGEAKADEPKPEGKPDAKTDVKPETTPKPDAKTDSKPEAKPGGKSDAKSDAKPGGKPEEKAAPKADESAAPNADEGAASKADDGPVDQPTGIFRVPSRPVDQPTTTLKRSTFVPLRPDDVPAERKKPQPAPAPAPVPSPAKPPAGVPAASAAAAPAAPAGAAAPAQPGIVEPTRQQPLPPKPPLDLLAELTNKPAAPETPVRTVVRRFKIWTPLVVLLLIIFAVVQSVRPLPDPSLTLTSAPSYSFGGSKVTLPWPNEGQGKISVAGLGAVDSFGTEKPVPIASMAKSMTAYLIMRDHPMKPGAKGASIPVDATAEKEGHYDQSGNESTLNTIKKGDVLSEKDALSAIMIPSANNVARLLARWDAGSEAAFVKKMNDTAKKLGMTQTKYTDPSGLTASTVSTADDQVKLGEELVKIPSLMDITKLPSWTDPSGKTWSNYNRLVPYNGAIGIKTGSTTNAGASLLFAAKQQVGGTTQYIVGAILSQHKTPIIDTVNAVSKSALLATESALTSRNVVKKGQVVGYVDDGLGGQTPVVATKDFEAAGWAGLKVDIKIGSNKTIPHSAKAGTVVGRLTVGSGPGKVTAPVALQGDLAKPGFGAKLTRIG